MYSILGRYDRVLEDGIFISAALAIKRPAFTFYCPYCKLASGHVQPVPIPRHRIGLLPLYHLFYGTAASLQRFRQQGHIMPIVKNNYAAAFPQSFNCNRYPSCQIKALIPLAEVYSSPTNRMEIILTAQIIWRVGQYQVAVPPRRARPSTQSSLKITFVSSILLCLLRYFFHAIRTVAPVIALYLIQKTHPIPVPLSFVKTTLARALSLTAASSYVHQSHLLHISAP